MQMRVWLRLKDKIIVGISGASGSVLAVRMLEELKKAGIETHVILTEAGEKVLGHETKYRREDIEKLSDFFYDEKDLGASVASGSFRTSGMVVVPCSMKTLAGIANGFAENLLLRAADVCLKERKRLVLVARETPLNLIHIENMKKVTLAGGVVLPPVLSFYSESGSVEGLVNFIIGKTLDIFGIENNIFKRWK